MAEKNRPCPACREKGEDSTGDHLYRAMSGTKPLNFYTCRKCGYREWADGKPIKDQPQVEQSYCNLGASEIAKLPSVKDRGISKATRELYQVKSELNPSDRSPLKHFYPLTRKSKTINYKYRDIATKDFKVVPGVSVSGDIDLFGMHSLKGTPKVVVITEGEEDAMAAHEMLCKTVHNIGCLSIPFGNNAMKAVSDNIEWLSKIDRVYYSPDMDDAGAIATEAMVALLPKIQIIADLSEKDANAMLLEGKAKDYINSFLRAEKYRPPLLVTVMDCLADAIKKPEWGRLWPWASLNKATYGMRDGEGMFVGAGVKIGKSEFINELVLHRINQCDGDIPAVIKFEEMPAVTVKKLAGKQDRTFYHKPDVKIDMAKLESTCRSLDGKLYMYRSFGAANWDIVKGYIRYVVANGTKTIIIDPVTKLTNHLSSSDTETELRRISDELACMAQDLGFFYIVTCHLKSPSHGTPHERGGKVQSNQFRGSRAMMENCYYMLGIERNKDPEIADDERNTSTFVLLEDRSFGNSAVVKVFYDKDSGSYEERVVTKRH